MNLPQYIFHLLAGGSPRVHRTVTRPARNIHPISEIPDRYPAPRRTGPRRGIQDRELTYAETHLPVTKKRIQAAINNPDATWLEMDALWFSANNSDDVEARNMLDAISRRQGELTDKP